jgi:hypothetical protein
MGQAMRPPAANPHTCLGPGDDPFRFDARGLPAQYPATRNNGAERSMQDFAAAIAEALRLIAGLDANLVEIVVLSLKVSLSATILGAAVGHRSGR